MGRGYWRRCWLCSRRGLGALCFDGFGSRAEMALHFSFFFLLKLLAKNIFVLGVGLAEVIVAKALAELHIAAALAVAFDDQLDAPLDFRGRTLPAAAKVLVVLNFELANVFFELRHFFVDGRHAEESPRFSNAKRTGRRRQQSGWGERRIGHGRAVERSSVARGAMVC